VSVRDPETDDDEEVARRPRGDVRHQGREAALQMLYQREVGRMSLDEVGGTFWVTFETRESPDDRVRAFATALAEGTIASLDRIDALIQERAEHWRPERMAVLDRLILRLGVYELIETDTPPNVVINEAIELARTFSTDDSVRFINGMLDGVKKSLEKNP
jgi:transcription antitermination protein NusB